MSSVLVGRGPEIESLDAVVSGAAAHRTRLVVGSPGIGKTALLDVMARRARRRGVRIVRTRAVEGSCDLPFAVLDDLHLALGAPAPVVAGPGPRAVALQQVLDAAAQRAPVLVVLDDAQNADDGSLASLVLALGRAESAGTPVSGVVACRPDDRTARRLATWPRLDLAPLSEESATAVLRSVLGAGIDPDVARNLAVALQGVPLALHEAARLLTPAQLAGRDPLPVPLPIAPSLMAAWGSVLDRLTARARSALLDLAVAGARTDLLAALADEAGWGAGDLDLAVSTGLVDPGPPPRFAHPLVRDVVLRSAPGSVQRGRYAVAAAAATALALPPAHVVGLLARSVVFADQCTAEAVEVQARRAESLGHLDAAARAWATSARLSVTAEERLARALRAVRLTARFDLDVSDVGTLLDLLAGVELEPEAASWVSWLRAAATADVDPHASLAAQWSAIREARRTSPAVLPVLLWDAAMSAWTLGRPDLGLQAAREAADGAFPAVGSGRAGPAWAGRALLAAALIQAGEVRAGMALRTEVLAEAAAADPAGLDVGALLDAVFLDDLLLDDGPDGAHRLAVAEARLAHAPEPLACLWGIEAWRARATGEWGAARTLLARARPMADASGASGASRGLAALATELAAACEPIDVLTSQARELRTLTDRWVDRRRRATCDRALGLRALLEGRLDDASAHLLLAADAPFLGRGLRDGVIPAQVDLVEAATRRGDTVTARQWADRVRPVLADLASPLSIGLLGRVDGLVAPRHLDAEAAYRAAVEAHAGSPEQFEQARTALLLGELLRRSRRRAEARRPLAEARDAFDHLGATPWAARAGDELRACGAVTTSGRSSRPTTPDTLTPQERAVAGAVAEGRSTQEAADLLSLSPRTVEHHLSSAYRKLGVRNRAGLSRAWADAGAHP